MVPSVLNSSPVATTTTPSSPIPKKKFRVLGFGSLDTRPRSPAIFSDDDDQPVLITTGGESRRKPSVTDSAFFAQQSANSTPGEPSSKTSSPSSPPSITSSMDVEEMKIDLSAVPSLPQSQMEYNPPPHPPPARSNSRPNFRLTPQWGPWTVSVAETPQDSTVYNVYINTPTHNYTLTRGRKEIVELHSKLRDSFPTANLPPFPLANVPITPSGGKRRSSFLHTLSRLASPNSSASNQKVNKLANPRPSTSNGLTASPSSPLSPGSYPTPLASPSIDAGSSDPFNDTTVATSSTAVITGLAAYLTSVSNDPKLRTSRAWKRFIRVRTEDLESVRVERAIKRVRSDLAKHTSPPTTSSGPTSSFVAPPLPVGNRLDVASKTGASMLSLGPNFGIGSLGLSPEGGFQSEAEPEGESPSEGPSKTTSDVDLQSPVVDEGHSKEETIVAPTPPSAPTSAEDKRVSSVMAMPSAFSSDSALGEAVQQAAAAAQSLGSAPPTPTPATAELPKPITLVAPQPEDVALPPSPHPAGEAAVSGLPTPVHSPPAARIPRSASADPSKRFKKDITVTEDGDTSMAEATDIDAQSTTTDADASRGPSKKRVKKVKKPAKKVTLDDFEMIRVLGKGCAGKVLLVRYKKTNDHYALKAITKRHVLAHQELQHTLTEQAVLKRMSREGKDPFVVKLWWSFHDKDNLFLVMDFHPGGDLATQLARWGRLGRDRARFYAAEIVEGVDGLHAAGVIYRDLKPENILIGSDGHIVLTDFGLSKEFPRKGITASTAAATPTGSFGGDYYAASSGSPSQAVPHWMAGDDANSIQGPWGSTRDLTSTFCGTAEYLAPEVIQGLPYSYEVDWWSFGTMLYEMLSGITPFWANNHSDMYVRVLQDELQFPDDRAMDQDTKSLIRGLLQRNPALRMSEPRIKRHPYFSMIDWDHVYYKRYIPPYIPPIDASNAYDVQNFDETFLEMNPTIENEDHVEESEREKTEDEGGKTDGEEDVKKAATKSETAPVEAPAVPDISPDVFDGYSFKGRHSVIIDGDDDGDADEEAEDDEELIEAKKVTDALAAMHPDANGFTSNPLGDDASDAGTIEQPKEDKSDQGIDTAVSATQGSSTPPDSIVTASIVTDSESVTAPKAPAHAQEPTKQSSGISEGASTIPSLTTGTTAATTPTGDLAESPLDADLAFAKSAAAAARIADGNLLDDEAVHAPLPLSPVIEAVDPATGAVVEEDAIPPVNVSKAPVARFDPKHVEGKAAPSTPVHPRTRGTRRDKGSVSGMDRIRHEEEATEQEDDWDLIETPHGEDRNGAKAPSLWQRGVVDRYRLAVFRKSGSTTQSSRVSRSVSGATFDSQDPSASPTPSEAKQRRGRAGISLRKSTREFLRAKSPSAAFSTQSSAASRASLAQQSPVNLSVNSAGLLTPSPSVPVAMSRPVPSLKSKSSAISRASGNSPPSSDQSVTDLRNQGSKSTGDFRSPAIPRTPTMEDPERPNNFKKMKKYTEQGAEKMFSLFSSPRHHHQHQPQQ